MAETLETAHEIQTIRFKIESIEGTQQLLLRSRASEIRDAILTEVFDKHSNLSEIYLAVDGRKSQAEIVEALRAQGMEISQPTVSRRLGILLRQKLVEEVEEGPRGMILRKKEIVEQGLGLSEHLMARTGKRERRSGNPAKS